MENKKNSTAQVMRQVAGWIYLVLCVFQMATLIGSLEAGFAQVPIAWLVETFFMLLVGAIAVFMIGGTGPVRRNVRRGVIAGTVMIVAFALITNGTQLSLMGYSLSVLLPNWEATTLWQLVLLLIRLVLYILAAFFVSSAGNDDKKQAETAEDDTLIVNETLIEGDVIVVEDTTVNEDTLNADIPVEAAEEKKEDQ